MINKLKTLFKIFNINKNEIPLFLKDFSITYDTISNDEKFVKKVDDKLIDYIVNTLHINKQWLYENSDEIIKIESFGYYKRAEIFCDEILSRYPTKLFILTQRRPNKNYDKKNDDNRIEIIAQYSLMLSNNKSINSYEVFNSSGCRWGYLRCRWELKKLLLCLNKHHFINRVDGKIFVEDFDTKFEDFKKGKIKFDNIYKQNDTWYPEDYIESKNSNVNSQEDDELIEILKELQEKNPTKSISIDKLFKKETDKYILYENNEYNFTIEDLAKKISAYLNTKFLLFREDNIVYTDNEYVLQILKYEVGFLAPISEVIILNDKNNRWLPNEQLSISTDFLIEERENSLEFRKKNLQVKWYYLYQKIYDMLFSLKNIQDVPMGQNIIQRTFGERLFNLLNSNDEFKRYNSWIEKFEKLKSIDPLHLFISFNAANQKDETRINRILILLKSLNSVNSAHFSKLISDIKKNGIEFNGCPMPMATKILSARNKDDQKIVWDIFFKLQNNNADINFSKIQNIYGIEIVSFTIFMFWCKPLKYLSLDKNTFLLLQNNKKIKELPQEYSEYQKLLDSDKKVLYVNLSKLAIDTQNQIYLTRYEKEEIDKYLSISQFNSKELEKTNFEIIALKVLEGSDKKYSKNLIKNHYYKFNNSYKLKNNKIKQIKIVKNIYNSKNNITLNAIVGKNGSGKSSIAEVLYGLIYNLSILLGATKDMQKNKKTDLFVELIFKHSSIYKLVYDKQLKIFEYQKKDEKWIDVTSSFNLNNFFYTIAINYSIYANNSRLMGEWIDKIFHKNDAYQTPIVIEPFRDRGNIDINNQNELAKQRLLVNLLKPSNDEEYSIRKLRESKEFAFATKVKLTFNDLKIVQDKNIKVSENIIYKNKKNDIKYKDIKNLSNILKALFKEFETEEDIKFDINNTIKEHSLIGKIQLYILKKIITTVYKYEIYSDFKNFNNVDTLVKQIFKDNTHITHKLKRAIYFLKYQQLAQTEQIEFLIEEYSNKLDSFLANNKNISYHQITPPSFYDIDIFLENSEKEYINFDGLSSGEKQRILFINSLTYHLENINSLNNQIYQYRYVNIILDEIELYYHPEYQREHIQYLLHNLEKTNLSNIFGLNIIFITHSPFILTDIIDTNVLFLDKNNNENILQTFGANMFELFEKGFFVKDSIGSFSSKYIKAISLILSYFQALKLENIFLLRRLLNVWYEIENKDLSQETIDQKDVQFLSTIKLNIVKHLQKTFDKNNLEYNRYKYLINEKENCLVENFKDYIEIISDEVVKKHFLNIYKDLV